MRERTTEADICLTDPATGVEYRVASIEYREDEEGSFSYAIRPRYEVVDLLSPPLFEGIPGIDLSLRLPEYVREGFTPVFVSERAPAENREDLAELLEAAGMEYLDKIEWLKRTDTRYSGDNLYVEPRLPPCAGTLDVSGELEGCAGAAEAAGVLLRAVATGRDVAAGDAEIGAASRKAVHSALRAVLAREPAGPRPATRRGAPGRPEKPLDEARMEDVAGRYRRGELTAEAAAAEMGIGRATFFRRLKRMCGDGGQAGG